MIEDREGVARKNLLKEMRDICFILTRQTWLPGLEYKLYDVLAGGADQIDGKALAPAILSHIDGLGQLSDDAGGWFTADDPESFVGIDDWESRFAAWKTGSAAS